MFEYFAGDKATAVQALLNGFTAFSDEILLRDINVIHTVYLSERPEASTDKRNRLGIEIMYHNCTVFLNERGSWIPIHRALHSNSFSYL